MLKQPMIDIINTTPELADVADKWFLDEKYNAWCLEDVLYTMKATTPKFQRLSIYVPGAYMSAPGVICAEGATGGYTAATAPIIFQNNSGGYMQMPHTWLGGPRDKGHLYLAAGMIYVTCGNRGSESRDQNGTLCGKSPANLIDLKTAIRFLRHNADVIPGNFDRIISVGTSAGGAMSALLALTGNHRDYVPYLEANGAFMDESDAVYASQVYCPITDLDHADLAYEWMFHEDVECEDSPAGPAGVLTPFQIALSSVLKKEYISYYNSLQLKDPVTGEKLVFGEDGRSGSAYEYLMSLLNESATLYLTRLSDGELRLQCSVQEYLAGEYSIQKVATHPRGEEPEKDDGASGTGMPGGPDEMEPPTLGDLMARPPKGMPAPPIPADNPSMVDVPGDEKSAWLTWDGEKAVISDLDTYLLHHRRRMKPCTSFDTLGNISGENRVFGGNTEETHYLHFDTFILQALEALKDDFPEEYALYAPQFAGIEENAQQMEMKRLYNAYGYALERRQQAAEGVSFRADAAQRVRIRVGAQDADTSFTISMGLALLLAETGIPTDYALVWDLPHCDADYEGEFVNWVRSITQ